MQISARAPDASKAATWYACRVSRRLCSSLIVALAMASLVTSSANASSMHRVLWVVGEVTAKQLNERNARPLPLQATDPLRGHVRINVPSEAEVWLLEGGRTLIGLQGPGSWDVPPEATLKGEGLVTQVPLGSATLKVQAIVPWIERARVQSPDMALLPISPVETALTTRRPVLRWKNQARVLRTSLTLVMRDAEGRERPVEIWRGLTGTHHEVRRQLKPGVDYAWRLEVDEAADRYTQDVTTSWFHVLSDDAVANLRRADTTISKLQLDYPEAVTALEVVRALTWEEHGLARQAQDAWDALFEKSGGVEALRLYRARLALRVLARPREKTSDTKAPR